MKKVISKILMVIGYFLLWMSISELYSFLQKGEAIENILASLSIVLPLGFIFRWFSLSEELKGKRVITIVDNVFCMFLVRGVIGLMAFFRLYGQFGIVSDSLFYGASFIIIGAIGLYLLNKFPNRKKLSGYSSKTVYDNEQDIEESDLKENLFDIKEVKHNIDELSSSYCIEECLEPEASKLVDEIRYCKRCGSHITSDSIYCFKCGIKLR